MFQLFRTPSFDFMGRRAVGYFASALLIAASIAAVAWHWSSRGEPLNYGIDFKGGSVFQVRFAEAASESDLRSRLTEAGFANAIVQPFKEPDEDTVLIRIGANLEDSNELVSTVRAAIRPAAEQAKIDAKLSDLNAISETELARLIQSVVTGDEAKSLDPIYTDAARRVVALRSSRERDLLVSFDEVRTADVPSDILKILEDNTFIGTVVFQRTESVGPVVGEDLRRKALVASLIANGLILLYLSMRFELRFGVAAVITLIHDLIVVLGVFAITNREFDLTVLAALLTVIGYSVNDTIVVFDRIRTNLKLMRGKPLEDVINAGINQTLSRTVMTSGSTLLVVVPLFLFGGNVLNGFAFALLIGIVVGTFSSIFVASPILLLWRRFFAH